METTQHHMEIVRECKEWFDSIELIICLQVGHAVLRHKVATGQAWARPSAAALAVLETGTSQESYHIM